MENIFGSRRESLNNMSANRLGYIVTTLSSKYPLTLKLSSIASSNYTETTINPSLLQMLFSKIRMYLPTAASTSVWNNTTFKWKTNRYFNMRLDSLILSENKECIRFLSCCFEINGTAVYLYEESNNSKTRMRLIMAMPLSLLGEEMWLPIICWTGTTLLSFLSGFTMNPGLQSVLFQTSFHCRRLNDAIYF
jgi:hypothetical protein